MATLYLLLTIPWFLAAPSGDGALVPARDAPWPQFGGPRRDAVSEEREDLLAAWPAAGPNLLWSVNDIGRGYSSPIVAGETVYVTGDVGNELVISAFDLAGARRWRVANGKAWKGSYPGSRSACTHDAGRIFHMNAHGRLVCLEAATGRERWAVEIFERFGASQIIWGMSESLVVDGQRVVVTPAGKQALMAALDAETGATVWTTPPNPDEKLAYASPILLTIGGKKLLVTQGMHTTFAVDAESGALRWSHPHPVRENTVAAMPLFSGDSVFVANSARDVSAIYRLRLLGEGQRVDQVWSQPIKSGHGGLIWSGDRIFAANARPDNTSGDFLAIDPASGEFKPVAGGLTIGSPAIASGRIYVLQVNGEMALLKPVPGTAEVVSRFRPIKETKNDAWAHPVVARGRLWLRYHETFFCYDVRRKGASDEEKP